MSSPAQSRLCPLTIRNNGDLGFGYTITTTATDALAPALELSVVKVADTASCTASTNFAPTTTADILVPSSTKLNAVAVTGSRALTTAASEVLCFKVELSQATDNTFQGTSASATFASRADQS